MTNPIQIAETETTATYRKDRVTKYDHNVTLHLVDTTTETLRVIGTVDAHGPHVTYGDHVKAATVNWAAHGSVSPDEAEQYVELIQRAASIARVLEIPTHVAEVNVVIGEDGLPATADEYLRVLSARFPGVAVNVQDECDPSNGWPVLRLRGSESALTRVLVDYFLVDDDDLSLYLREA